MKIINLLLVSVLMIMTSCTPTNEDRAERLVSSCIKDYLTYPDSYESISTHIDSTRVDVSKIEEILEYTKDVATLGSKVSSLEFDLESAQSTMEIYAPKSYYYSDFERGQYNRAKAEYEEHKSELQRLNEKLLEKIFTLRTATNSLYTNEPNGWIVTHRYRSNGDDGEQLPPQEMIFFCDMAFEHCQGWTSKQYEFISNIIKSINESETDDELVDNLGGLQYFL